MINKRINNNHGMALAVVIMVFAVVAILGATALSLSVSQTKQSVSAEDYTEAYYIARSATDTVSTDIINQINELNNNAIDEDSDEEAQTKYYELLEKVEKLLTTGNVIVNGIANSGTITSNVVVTEPNPGEQIVTVETKYTQEGRTGTAKVQLGKIVTSIEKITVDGDNTNAIYTWGDLEMGNSFTLTGNGQIGFGGTFVDLDKFEDKNPDLTIKPLDLPVDIIAPTPVAIKNANSLVSTKDKGKFPVVYLDSDNSGNYGYINLTDNNKTINWEINTNEDDVIIVLNKLVVASNDATIKVSGSHNFYLFLVEDTDSELMRFESNFDITGKNANGAPLTYIISYTKGMQAEGADGSKTTTNEEIAPYASASIKNSSFLDAYIYLPGTVFEIKNKADAVTGSIFASDFKLWNSATLNFKPFAPGGILATSTSMGGSELDVKKVEISSTDYNDLKKIWIK